MAIKNNNPYRQGRLASTRRKLDAFLEGYEAFNTGLHLEDNPYEPDSVSFEHWQKGWLEAQQEQNKE